MHKDYFILSSKNINRKITINIIQYISMAYVPVLPFKGKNK